MVLANLGDFLKDLRCSWRTARPARRPSSAKRQNSQVADAAECLEVRVVPAASPVLNITPAVTVAEGNSATTEAVFTVTLSAASTASVTVVYTTTDGTATTADGDYQAKTGNLTFAPGETTKTFSVLVNGDTKFEPNETFSVALLSPTIARIGNGQGTATITNDDSAPTVSIGSPGTVFEGNSGTKVAIFPVTLSNPSSVPVTIHYATMDGTATVADNDYVAGSGNITFAPGETTKKVEVTIKGDTKAETDETFDVKLTSPTPASVTIPTPTATATIGDDDTLPVLSVNNPASINEGDTGAVTLLFTVTLSATSTQTVTVAYTTADGTATIAGDDYTAASGTLTFAPGQATKEISVVVKADIKSEADETILLQLSAPTNARVAVSPGTATITDDDIDNLPSVSVSQAPTVTEGNTDTVDATFHVVLSQATGQAVTVTIATADGSAKVSDNDYLAGSTTITFAPGETDKTFVVKVNGDTKLEANENFSVSLSGATNATLGTATIAGTITNDDGGAVSIAKTADGAETTPPSKGKFTVTQSGISATDTVVTYTVAGTAESGEGNDYAELSGTVTIPAGQTSVVINVTPFNDDETEVPETVIVTLDGIVSGDGSVELDPDTDKLTATLQILDATGLPSLTAGAAVTYTAKQSPIKILPQATVGEATLGGGTLSISVDAVVAGNFIVDRFRFPKIRSLGTTDGFQYVNNRLVITIDLKENVTAAAIQSFLRGLKFSTKDTGLAQPTRSFVVSLANAAGQLSSVTQTINVNAGG